MFEGINLFLVVFLVLANGFFVASEFALVGVRRSRIATLAANGDKGAQRLLGLVDNLNAYISATQLGITLSSLALGWIGEPAIARLLEMPLAGLVSDTVLHTISFTVAFGIITFLHIVLGELAPKTIALERAEKTALAIARPMAIFYKVFYYPIRLLDWAGTRTVRLLGLHPSGEHASIYTEDELRELINISQKSGHLEEEERQLINRVFDFSSANVRDAMIPRVSVEGIALGATLDEIKFAFRELGYSRLPVYRERMDSIVGILFRRDLEPFLESRDGFELESLLHAPLYIPETAKLGSVLRQMQSTNTHLAIVVDEHGGMEGIVTIEDLLEEIVGEINDEFDEEVHSQIVEEPNGSYILDGRLAIRDANRQLDLQLPENEGYSTLSGFLMEKAGRVLKPGEEIEHREWFFTIDQTDKHRILRARLFRANASDERDRNNRAKGPLALALLIGSFVFPSFGQNDRKITDTKHDFSLLRPVASSSIENKTALLAFAGDERAYGSQAKFLLGSIQPITMELDQLEGYMKSEKAVRSFDDAFIRSMSSSFPAIRAAGCRFEYFRERPAIQGTFTFGRGKAAMKGRYLIILISEQASLYTFSWSASKRRFIKWDKQSRASVESLTIFIPPTRDVALGKS